MEEQKINEIYSNMMKQYVDEPLELEQQITDTAKQVAMRLHLGVKPMAEFEFLGDHFIVKAKQGFKDGKNTIFMVITNQTTMDIDPNRYVPFTVESYIDNEFSLLENYTAIMETFLKHISNTERPTVLPD